MPNPILDVDESIIKNNLLLIEKKNEVEQLDKLMKTLESDNIPFVIVRPSPGLCIKTKTHNNEKVFINLCHTTEIPPPEDIAEEEFFTILDYEVPTWCIPMSVGHERFESSKDGTKCLTYDIAVNTGYFKKIQIQKHYLAFTVMTMISAIESKYNKNLNSKNYVVLQNRTVLGKLHDHRVQKREVRKPTKPKSLIVDISNEKKFKKNIEHLKKPTKIPNYFIHLDNPQYIILMENFQGNDKEKTLTGYYKLPNKCRPCDVNVSVNEDRIVVELIGFNYLVDIFVAYVMNRDKVLASMGSNFQILQLEILVISG